MRWQRQYRGAGDVPSCAGRGSTGEQGTYHHALAEAVRALQRTPRGADGARARLVVLPHTRQLALHVLAVEQVPEQQLRQPHTSVQGHLIAQVDIVTLGFGAGRQTDGAGVPG
jgi:hypothetical protein